MAENRFVKKRRKSPWFRFPETSSDLEEYLSRKNATRFIPHLLFLAALGIFYIANAHYAERMVREISRLEAEVETLRSNYTTIKAEYDIFTGKQSEISREAQEMGLEESEGKVQKIIIEDHEY